MRHKADVSIARKSFSQGPWPGQSASNSASLSVYHVVVACRSILAATATDVQAQSRRLTKDDPRWHRHGAVHFSQVTRRTGKCSPVFCLQASRSAGLQAREAAAAASQRPAVLSPDKSQRSVASPLSPVTRPSRREPDPLQSSQDNIQGYGSSPPGGADSAADAARLRPRAAAPPRAAGDANTHGLQMSS